MEKIRNNLGKKVRKYMDINKLTYKDCKAMGVSGVVNTVNKGNTCVKTLFNISKLFGVDIRNLFLYTDKTYIFKNYFDNFDDFYRFIGAKFKAIRIKKGITTKDFLNRLNNTKSLNSIYDLENASIPISTKKLYQYIEALGLSPEEFFLMDEEYEIAPEKIDITKKNKEEFYFRLAEVEKIRGKSVGSQVNINPNKIPTLHIFLNICKSLKIHPRDFFNFDKKEFAIYKLKDVNNWVNTIRNQIDGKYLKSNRYIELDTIFRFCDDKNISIADFFDFEPVAGIISQSGGVSL